MSPTVSLHTLDLSLMYEADDMQVVADEIEEVDEAVEAQENDPTGGRGANGRITKALEEKEDKGEMMMRSAV